jgi:hypothetical protein
MSCVLCRYILGMRLTSSKFIFCIFYSYRVDFQELTPCLTFPYICMMIHHTNTDTLNYCDVPEQTFQNLSLIISHRKLRLGGYHSFLFGSSGAPDSKADYPDRVSPVLRAEYSDGTLNSPRPPASIHIPSNSLFIDIAPLDTVQADLSRRKL